MYAKALIWCMLLHTIFLEMQEAETLSPISQRINAIMEYFEKGVQRQFARQIGVAPGRVSELFGERKSKPTAEFLRKVASAYPQVHPSWLLLGEGQMLKSDESPKNNFVYASEPRAYAVQEGENRGALLYNLPTAASYLGQGNSQERAEPDGIITMPNWLLRSGDYAVFPVIGDSMEPTFFAKDYVVCRFLPSPEWAYVNDDNVAVIVTESRGLQLKRLRLRTDGDEKYVRCISDNRQHQSYNIDLSEVLEIWRFEWRITANAINVTETLNDRIARLEDGQDDLRRLVESMVDSKELRRLESLRNPMAQD
jgi:phage repressor protein C with HTH and peptisase S24 domain